MKLYSFLITILILAASCSNEAPVSANTDSTSGKDSLAVREILTDSGKLVLTDLAGMELDSAVMFNNKGVIVARGFYYDNKPTGAWIRYDETGKIISATHYSEGNAKYALDIADFETVRTSFTEMGITAELPSGWAAMETPNPASLISYEKKVNEKGILMMPNFNIAKGKMEAGQTLATLAAEQLNMLHNAVGRVELVDESYLTIDSCKAFRRYGMYYTEDNKIGFLDAIIVKGDTIWVISCAAQNREQGEFLKYQSVFENLVMSIEIL